MKCLIVINPFSVSPSLTHKISRVREELQSRGIEPVTVDTIQLRPLLENSVSKVPGADGCTFCIYLDKDKYCARMLETLMPVFNSSTATALCDDKTTTFLALEGSGIRTPKTIPAPLCYSEPDPSEVKEFLDRVQSDLGYPLVCKQAYGSMGKQVYLIRNREELDAIYPELHRVTHLYQEYIGGDTSRSSDYRIITVGGEAVACMRRVNESDFRSNIACGGRGENAEDVPQAFRDVAVTVSRRLGLDLAGVDLIPDSEGNPVLLEVNSNAFFQEVEPVTGVNVAGLFVDRCIARTRRFLDEGLYSAKRITEGD